MEIAQERVMANAKDSASPKGGSIFKPTATKRTGAVTEPEKVLVKQFVLDHPGPLQPKQVKALATLTRRSVAQMQAVIEEAAVEFAEAAKDYVWIHKQATSDAYATGDFETAVKASQWAIEKIGKGNVRVIEPAKGNAGEGGTKILIGIRLGGMKSNIDEEVILDASKVSSETEA
jgi:hypothetical protein